jgi:hypothetical protein
MTDARLAEIEAAVQRTRDTASLELLAEVKRLREENGLMSQQLADIAAAEINDWHRKNSANYDSKQTAKPRTQSGR